MWNLDLEKLKPLASGYLGNLAIETGTCRGNGAKGLAKSFSRVITIELSSALHRSARERLRGLKNVECLEGNSIEVFTALLPTLAPEDTVFFFLDAHWSGDQSVDWSRSAWKGYGTDTAHLGAEPRPSGPEQCPLLEELYEIMRLCRSKAHILIDDAKNLPAEGPGLRDGTFVGEDWSHLSREKIRSVLDPRLASFHELKEPEQIFVSLRSNP
jgi:hypothetical protein